MKRLVAYATALLLVASLASPEVYRTTAAVPGSPGLGSTNAFTGTNSFSGSTTFTGRNTFGSAADALNSIDLGAVANCVVFEGATADAHETRLCAVDATVGDGTINLPNVGAAATRTLASLEAAQSFTAIQTFASAVVTQDLQGVTTKSLTDAAIATFVRVSCASGAETGGIVHYTVKANDASNRQLESGMLQFACTNPAGTETCPTPTEVGTPLQALSSGTITTVWAADTATPTNGCDLRITADSSLTTTGESISYRVEINSGVGVTVTPQ